jgi:hypothetical protein
MTLQRELTNGALARGCRLFEKAKLRREEELEDELP